MILIFEPDPGGHRMHYVRRIANAIAMAGHQSVLVTSRSATLSDSFQVALGDTPLDVVAGDDILRNDNQILRQIQALRWLKRSVRQVKPDQIIVPFGNHLDKAVAGFGLQLIEVPLHLIVMRDRFHLAAMGVVAPDSRPTRLEEWTHRQLLNNRKVQTLFTIDPLLHAYARRCAFPGADKIVHLPDPITPLSPHSQAAAREELGVPPHEKVLLLYGALDSRKGIENALKGTLANGNLRAHLLAVGRQNEGATKIFESEAGRALRAQGRLTEVNRYVDARTEGLAFAASDAVWVGYHGHYGQSGVLFQAAAMGIPTVATFEGLIGHEARSTPNGTVLESHDEKSAYEAVRAVLAPSPDERILWKTNADHIANSHSDANFVRLICDRLFAWTA